MQPGWYYIYTKAGVSNPPYGPKSKAKMEEFLTDIKNSTPHKLPMYTVFRVEPVAIREISKVSLH